MDCLGSHMYLKGFHQLGIFTFPFFGRTLCQWQVLLSAMGYQFPGLPKQPT